MSSATEQVLGSAKAENKAKDNEPVLPKHLLVISWGSLAVAMIEAVCVTFIALSGFALLVGAGTIVLAKWATYLHDNDFIRLPLLGLASLGAVTNLLVLANGWWLRRAPSARWRYRPLTSAEWRRILLIMGSSLLTLGIVIAELHEHKVFHGHF